MVACRRHLTDVLLGVVLVTKLGSDQAPTFIPCQTVFVRAPDCTIPVRPRPHCRYGSCHVVLPSQLRSEEPSRPRDARDGLRC